MSSKRGTKDVSARRRKMQSKGIPWTYVIPVVILISIIGGLIFYNTYVNTTTITGLTPVSVSDVTTVSSLSGIPLYCDGQSGCTTFYHWHIHLDIYVGNTSYVFMPSDLGHIGSVNLFAIHTHDSSGVIHLECCGSLSTNPTAPGTNQTLYLGQLFEVWGYPQFDSTHCLGYSGQNVTVYVNGAKWTSVTPISQIPFSNHEEIAIVIGNAHPPIPSTYAFPSNL
ncbi:MAG: hypothetical protein ACYC7D_06050 [Nitrososphaerales archaeon]